MTTDFVRAREIVRAALDVPIVRVATAARAVDQLVHDQAVAYAGPMPCKSAAGWRDWQKRVEAFEWSVFHAVGRKGRYP